MNQKSNSAKNILLEFYGTDRYAYELISRDELDISRMDSKWEGYFNTPIANDPEGGWEMSDCEVEPLFEVSVTADGWHWSVNKRLWVDNTFKVIYIKEGSAKEIEDALADAMTAFEEVLLDGYSKDDLEKLMLEVKTNESVSD